MVVLIIAILSKKYLVQSGDVEGHQIFWRLYGIRIAIYFCEIFQCYTFHKIHNI